MRVSVVLPCYNAQATLGACLDSLLSQTFTGFEIVAVDDGSTDDTLSILQRYSSEHDRIRVFSIPHSGVADAANAGHQAAIGEYHARMDADDIAKSQRLAVQVDHLDSNPKVGVVGCRVAFGGDPKEGRGYGLHVDWTNSLLTHDDIFLNRFVESPLPNPSVMFRADLIREHGEFRNGPFPEDYEFYLRLLDRGVRMEKADQELLVWNDPSGRISRTDSRYDMDAFYRVKAEYLARWLKKNNPYHPEVHVLGAGRVTRKRAEMLVDHGIRITAYYDLDPRKIGYVVNGRPVLHRSEITGPGRTFYLSYVASRGAREDIAEFMTSCGLEIGVDWLPAA